MNGKQPRPSGFEPAQVFEDGRCTVPKCCGTRMTDNGDCGQGCCDDYKCGTCGYICRVEWPD